MSHYVRGHLSPTRKPEHYEQKFLFLLILNMFTDTDYGSDLLPTLPSLFFTVKKYNGKRFSLLAFPERF